jgi:hypothetical protein
MTALERRQQLTLINHRGRIPSDTARVLVRRMDWPTAAVALASSGIGGSLAIAGGGFSARRQERLRRREEAARIAAAALAALYELNPEVWGDRIDTRETNRPEEALAMAAEKRERWLEAADGLYVLLALYPGGPIADHARSVINGGNVLSIRLDEVAHGAGIGEAWRTAMPEAHARALEAAESLVREVQRVDKPQMRSLRAGTWRKSET